MLDRLIDFAVHRRVLTLLLSAAFAVFGVFTFAKLKIEAFPDVTNVQVMVITLYPGQAAEEVEKKVTIPVERALTGTPRVLVQIPILRTSGAGSMPTTRQARRRPSADSRALNDRPSMAAQRQRNRRTSFDSRKPFAGRCDTSSR